MKKGVLLIFVLFICGITSAQKINGQWRGYFDSNGDISLLSGGNTEYVLDLEINGSTVSGNSYTYFYGRKYYVICSLNGTYDKKTNKIVVNEVTRVKGMTPEDWSDCLQTHVLYYGKEEGKEVLSGNWQTSPYQGKENGGCGKGSTTLSRKEIKNTNFTFNKQSRTPVAKVKVPEKKIPSFKDLNKTTTPPIAKATPKPKPSTPVTPPVVKNENPVKKEIPKPVTPPATKKEPENNPPQEKNFEKRNTNIVKTIEIEKDTFTVSLYDNGDIDGDTVSVFFNGKLIVAHRMLTASALKLTLQIDPARAVNELVMYADNLGEIPPNTALMVVNDGDSRYEVRIASTLEQSGTIRFVHRPRGAN
jgi:hypothetical protein